MIGISVNPDCLPNGRMKTMPINTDKLAKLAPRSGQKVVVLDQPPLGHLQALVLKTLDDLKDNASGLEALETLSIKTGVWIDQAQVYGSIRKLDEMGLIKQVGERKEARRGPPLKLYEVTKAGREALKETTAHHKAVAEFLETELKHSGKRLQPGLTITVTSPGTGVVSKEDVEAAVRRLTMSEKSKLPRLRKA